MTRHRPRSALAALLVATLLATSLLAPGAGAQRTLADLQRRFVEERDALIEKKEGQVSFEDIKALATGHAELLARFLAQGAEGIDAINGRLLLTNIYLDIGDEAKARDALRAIDADAAPAMELATAAEMAQVLGMSDERGQWIQAALRKPAPFDERMALGMFLMTRLVEVDLGEEVFAKEMKAATTDSARAKVAWYQAAAIREREDLEDDAYVDALRALAKNYPSTYFGGVARDRLRALELEVGDDAIPIAGKTVSGKQVSLADYAGKVVLLDFWAPWSRSTAKTATVLAELRATYGARGFEVLGVVLGDDREAAKTAISSTGMAEWSHLFDGRGWLTDAALRYGVEHVPYHVLIDRKGKVRALRVFLHDPDGVGELREAIEGALGG